MTIELYFSNRLEALADKFAEIMSAAKAEADVLEAPAVVVPNANLAKWLKLFLAQDTGICMNVGFRYLEDGLWEMLSALDEGEVPPERMDEERRVLLLLHVLEHLEIDDPDMAPVARYLLDDGGSRRPDYPARLWQFSHRLAGLFQEYEYHRTDMVQRWLDPAAAPPRPMERCQQKLYLRMKRLSEDASKRSGRRLLSLWQYADEVLSGSAPDAMSPYRRCGCVHFFGLSQISVFHLRLLGRLQPCWDMHIYAFNPSREFWEDVQTPRERRWIRRSRVGSLVIQEAERESGELAGAEDNALLAAWGKPGRESVRLLCELTDYNFNSCFAVPDAEAGVLHWVQSDILSRSSAAGDGHRRLRQDRSLQIAACPSRSREVETVHDSILVNLEQDESLQLTDIAVLVPDISAYKPLFDTVFQRKPARISYNLVDSHAEIESVYGNAVLSVLALCAGRFTRNEVFALLLNPCFMSRWNIEPEAVHAWAEWTEALNIFHCFDRASKRSRGYPDSDAYTWKLGLQRLRLSRIMAAPQVVDPRGFVHYRGRVPYGDLRTGETGLLETFCTVIETLHGAVERLRQPGAGGRQWCRRFFEVCDRLLEVPDDRRGESAVRQALVRAFQGLEFYDDLYAAGSQPVMDVEWVREFVHAHLRAISGGHGDYLTGGVTVSALRPMRPIPFRLVYVLGMEEGSFPGRAETSSLDLRLARRRIGDISLPERNAYLFLEALLSVRDRLYLSYVSRDLQKDRNRQPCILLHQLMRVVEEEILPPGQRFRVAEVPLAGSSDRYCDPGAVNEWSDVLVNRSLADRVAWLRIRGRWEAFRRRASAQDLERVGRFTPELAPPAGSRAGAAAAETEEKVTLRQLKRFLVNPVREKVRRHLGLFDEEASIEDVVLREDEPFYSEFPTDYRLKMDAVRLWMDRVLTEKKPAAAVPETGALVGQVYEAYRRTGSTPEGAFAEIDRFFLEDQVRRHLEVLTPVVEAMRSARRLFRAVVFGEPYGDVPTTEGGPAVSRLPALPMTVRTPEADGSLFTRRAELHGLWPWVWQDREDAWHALVLSGSARAPRLPEKTVLEAVLCYLTALAGKAEGERPGPAGVTLHVAYREQRRTMAYALDSAAAGTYLQELVSDYLTASRHGWLPFEAAASLPDAPHRTTDRGGDAVERDRFAAELEEALSEEEDPLVWIARPVVPEDAYERARRRFGPFFRSGRA